MAVSVSRRAALRSLGCLAMSGGMASSQASAAAQTRTFEAPPKGFDPRSAAEEQLKRYGLLARPTASSSQQYRQLWNRSLSRNLNVVVPKFRARRPSRRMLLNTERRETTNNWAGVAVRAGSAPLISIADTWTVPYPHTPDASTGKAKHYNSAWVGIDGYLPPERILQAGVDFNFTVGSSTVEVAPWWEWWPGDSEYFDNFQAAPGDIISCVISGAVGSAEAVVRMANLGSNRFVSFLARAPAGTTLTGNCAEWIVERQTQSANGNAPLSDLAQFGTIFFDSCFASSGSIEAHDAVIVDAGSGTPISMTADSSSQLLAVPSILGSTTFKVDRQ
jgi:hypothetical protein